LHGFSFIAYVCSFLLTVQKKNTLCTSAFCVVKVLSLDRPPGSVSYTNCPPANAIYKEQKNSKKFSFKLIQQNPFMCGSSGNWTRVAYLDMSDANQQCPSNWWLTTSPVWMWKIQTGDSVMYPVKRRTVRHWE